MSPLLCAPRSSRQGFPPSLVAFSFSPSLFALGGSAFGFAKLMISWKPAVHQCVCKMCECFSLILKLIVEKGNESGGGHRRYDRRGQNLQSIMEPLYWLLEGGDSEDREGTLSGNFLSLLLQFALIAFLLCHLVVVLKLIFLLSCVRVCVFLLYVFFVLIFMERILSQLSTEVWKEVKYFHVKTSLLEV
ncbi:hypothetical protein JEQ12_004977 [Ovis aries]|uniref:Uncharacterized protein n=1 Tax=Ovis aries TaxID=9940 RepID=A0A836CYV8_SHEEP|nr:hypothetical protein JEQ12_004977 [Ovis aries]